MYRLHNAWSLWGSMTINATRSTRFILHLSLVKFFLEKFLKILEGDRYDSRAMYIKTVKCYAYSKRCNFSTFT